MQPIISRNLLPFIKHSNIMNTTIDTPYELLFDQLRDLYSVEVQLRESMPHLVSLCTNEELGNLLVGHACQNCNQIAEIAAIFERHRESPGDDRCKAMAGLIEGGTAHLEGVRSPHNRDLMMIAHCLRIEYYETAAYEFSCRLSRRLGLMREPEVLNNLLAEEKDMLASLMRLEPALFENAENPTLDCDSNQGAATKEMALDQ